MRFPKPRAARVSRRLTASRRGRRFQTDVDAQVSYVIKLGGSRNVTLLADVFNLFDTQTVLMYDQWTQLTGPAPNPDFGAPITQVLAGAPPQFQTPRQIRLGARLSF